MRAHAAVLELLVVAEPPQLPSAAELAGLHELLRERLRTVNIAVRKSVFNALIASLVVHDRDDIAPTFRLLAAQPAEDAMAASAQTSGADPSTADLAVEGSVFVRRDAGWRRAIGVRTPTLLHRRLRLPTARTRSRPDVPGRLRESLRELVDLSPGVAVSVDDVVAQLGRSGVVRDRGTVGDWLQVESLEEAGVVFRVGRGYYALRDAGAGAAVPGCPVVPMPETEARVLTAAAALESGGRASWTLVELVDEIARCGPALSRRRLHDVVTALRVADEPWVARAAHGRFWTTGV